MLSSRSPSDAPDEAADAVDLFPPPLSPEPPGFVDEAIARARDRPVALAVSVLAVAAVAALGVWAVRAPRPVPEITMPVATSAVRTTTPTHVVVHAAGAVAEPGVYRLPDGARVDDLLDAAGTVPDADLDRLNLAAPLRDGERVYVPLPGEAVPASDAGDGADPQPVDLNRATPTELEALPGVGPATAAAIVEHRERHGPFGSVDDLLGVRGIGEAKLASLRDLVRV